MKKAFTLIEVLIAIFVLALALLGIAAVFAKTTIQMKQNTEEIQSITIRRSADAYYPFLHRENELQLGWNLEYVENLSQEYKILYITYRTNHSPAIVVVAAFKGQNSAYTVKEDDYVPRNRDILITWYGFIHQVENDTFNLQQSELKDQFVVLPFETMSVLDVHRRDLYDNLEPK